MPWRCYIYIRSNIRNVQFIIVYHSLSKYHTSKFFPCCLLKKTLYGFGHVFVHHMIDHGHSSITVLACGFLSMISYAFQYPQKKLHQSAHVCHVWTVDTANQQIHSISVMFFHLIDLPWFSWNRLSKFLREQNITFPTGSEACESSGTRRYWKRLLAPMLCAMLEDCYGCAIESVDGAIKQMDIQLHCAIAV